ERLAAAGGHEHQRVAAAQDGAYDLLLEAAERVVAEDGPQHLEGAAVARPAAVVPRRRARCQPTHSPARITGSSSPDGSSPSTSTWSEPIMKSTCVRDSLRPAARRSSADMRCPPCRVMA